MAENETIIKIKTTSDTSGGERVEKQQNRIIAKSKEMGEASRASSNASASAMDKFRGTMGKILRHLARSQRRHRVSLQYGGI